MMMLHSLREAQLNRDAFGKEVDRNNCTYYAYCILHNHMHLLMCEGALSVSEIMKRVQNRFVRLYNDRYERLGHLFQDRFLSEPVDEDDYFYQLIRYIHRNPVKAFEAEKPEDYEFSSWREYVSNEWITGSDPMIHLRPTTLLCDTYAVKERFGEKDILEWVNMDVDDHCLDMNDVAGKLSDATAWEILQELSETSCVEEFKQLSPEWQIKYIKELLQHGISLRQASRLSSLTYTTLWRKLSHEE